MGGVLKKAVKSSSLTLKIDVGVRIVGVVIVMVRFEVGS